MRHTTHGHLKHTAYGQMRHTTHGHLKHTAYGQMRHSSCGQMRNTICGQMSHTIICNSLVKRIIRWPFITRNSHNVQHYFVNIS